ncbi:MAG TPA: hypothetical protein VNS63_19765 [Blastocatellia bacterium]|nr:hypothetical protein [Blastocatellia bacterium]
MVIILVILALVFVCALGLHAYKQLQIRRAQRMSQNEYNTAVKVWEYARLVGEHIGESVRQGKGVLDFTRITVPHSPGYRVSIELIGTYFRVYAVPNRYNRTGRLSFVTDTTLSVRAADRQGNPASADDAEYEGDTID